MAEHYNKCINEYSQAELQGSPVKSYGPRTYSSSCIYTYLMAPGVSVGVLVVA